MASIHKQVLGIITFILFFTLASIPKAATAQYENTYVSYNDFYQDLAPYGQWIDDPKYGYVWSPTQDGSFRPYYTSGHWVMTSYGNTWVSDYPWGWACFHYGRWTYDNYYGWIWIPGTTWGPSWVCWRYGDGYYGWAPLGPNYDFGNSMDYYCPNDWWVFIPPQYLYSGNYYHYWYGPRGNNEIIHHTDVLKNNYVANNVSYVSGPGAKDVEKLTHQPVMVYQLTSSKSLATHVHNNEVKMFRPAEIRPAPPVDGRKVSPPNVVTAPQPIKAPQPVNTAQASTPPFREDIPKNNGRDDAIGTNIQPTAEPQQPVRKNEPRPYEWDVNKPIPQPAKPEPAPEPRPQPAPAPQPAPQPHPQPSHPPRPAPAPAPGGRK